MSNVIPIVSSSPPPMDDSGGFDGWDDDDFGTFTGADDSVLSTPGKPSDWSTPAAGTETDKTFTFTSWSQSEAENIQGNNPSTADSGISEFANFSNVGGSTNLPESEHLHSDNENEPGVIKLDNAHTNGDEPIAHEVRDIKQSLTDSGLDNSDISPLQQTEVTDSDNKSHSDSESIAEPHLDKNSTEISDEKDSLNSEHLSDGDINDSLQNQQIPEETKYLDSESDKSEKESESQSNLNETHDSSTEKSVSNTSEDKLQLPPKSIPQAQNSSHSFDDGEMNQPSLSQPHVQADAHNSATITECVDSDTDEMTHDNEYQTDNEVKESQISGNVKAKSEAVDEITNELTTNDKCDSEPVSNCDLKTDFDNHSDHFSQSEESLPVSMKSDSGQNHETKNAGSRTLVETSDNLGSCNVNEEISEGSRKDSDLNLCPEQMNVSTDSGTNLERTGSDSDVGEKETVNSESPELNHTANESDDAHDSLECDENVTKDKNGNENKSEDFNDFNSASSGNENEFDDFSAFNSETIDTKSKEEEYDDSCTFESESTNKEVAGESETNDFNAFKEEEKSNSDEADFDDFTAFTSENDNDKETEFGKFSENDSKSHTATDVSTSDFGAFPETGGSFAAFGSESVADNAETSENADDWAVFSEPQISQPVAASDIDDEEWAAFGGDEEPVKQKDDATPTSVQPIQPSLRNLSNQEKVLYAVTGCFLSVIAVADVEEDQDYEDVLEIDTKPSECDLWGNMRGLKTTNALGYHWSQSQWNNHLYSTLHVDTRNILFGHKKSSSMPIFASGLTMLEPTKGPMGPGSRSQETLVDTTKPDDSQVYTQDSIPPAQFDWSSSGLTNPLEAANKTLNLDFLIQEAEHASGKSHALESEFLVPDDASSHKPATIQPLENILANLKSSSTFKPTNQKEDLGQEASRIIQSLPNLSFMKTKVLMFPLKLND